MRYTVGLLLAGLCVLASSSPAGAFGRGGAVGGVRVGPGGGYAAGGAYGGTRVTPGGTTVQHAGARGVAAGPYGGAYAGRESATRVTTPTGQTYTHVNSERAAVGPAGGVRVGGASGTAVRGPYGTAVGGYRGGAAVGPVGGAYAGYRGVAMGPAGGVRVGAVGHGTTYYSSAAVRTTALGVRGGYYPYFTPTWYRNHPVAWFPPRWVGGSTIWVAPAWNTVAGFVGIAAPPVVYDYGSTVVINDDTVYVDGIGVSTADDYASQATTIADAGRAAKPAETDEWQPLGVFGMIQPEDKVAQRIFQLSIDKAGVIRGNYYDAVADTNTPVYGSVDKKSQRAAWSIGERKDITFETGLPNLTKDEATVLIHYGKEKTQQMLLVRLEEPKDK